jgi:hypothetical protein
LSPDVAVALRQLVLAVLPDADIAPERIGNAPKFLLVFRNEGEPFAKQATGKYVMPDGSTAEIEILANGQQFVAFHVHPGTGKPYDWPGDSLLDLPIEDLPAINLGDVQQLIARAKDRLVQLGGKPEGNARQAVSHTTERPELSVEWLRAPDPAACAEVFLTIPNDNLGYDEWIRLFLALFTAMGPENRALGRSVWLEWSAKADKNDPRYSAMKWDGQFRDSDAVGVGTIYKEAGLEPPARPSTGQLITPEMNMPWIQPWHPIPTGTVEDGRAELAAAGEAFFDRIPEYSRQLATYQSAFNELDGMITFPRPLPLVTALQAGVGVGKTELVLRLIITAIAAGTIGNAVYLVPAHTLTADLLRRFTELAAEMGHPEIKAAVYYGRSAADPRDMKLPEADRRAACSFHEQAAAISAGSGKPDKLCKKGDDVCPHFETCWYRKQRKETASVWFVAHNLLGMAPPKPLPDNPDLVVIDEGFIDALTFVGNSATRITVDELREVWSLPKTNRGGFDAEATSRLVETAGKVTAVLDELTDGPLTRSSFVDAGVIASECGEVAALLWRLMKDLDIRPGVSMKKLDTDVQYNKSTRRLIRFWKSLESFINSGIERSGRMRLDMADTKHGRVRETVLSGLRDVHEAYVDTPTLILDATLRPELIEHVFPGVEVAARVNPATPHMTIRQIICSGAKSRFVETGGAKDETNKTRRNRLRDLAHFIEVMAAKYRGMGRWINGERIDGLVVVNKDTEEALLKFWGGKPPDGFEIRHFNSLRGVDRYGGVAYLLSVGRTRPPQWAIAAIAGAITGEAVDHVETGDPQKDFPTEKRGIAIKGGDVYLVDTEFHPDPMAEQVLCMKRDDELIQTIGRGRAVNRTELNPLHVDLVCDFPLPIEVDEVVADWNDAMPNKAEIALAKTRVLPFAAEAASAMFPELWKDARAFNNNLGREAWGTAFAAFRKSTHFPIKDLYREMSTFLRRAPSRLGVLRYRPASGRKTAALIAAVDGIEAAETLRAALNSEVELLGDYERLDGKMLSTEPLPVEPRQFIAHVIRDSTGKMLPPVKAARIYVPPPAPILPTVVIPWPTAPRRPLPPAISRLIAHRYLAFAEQYLPPDPLFID